jgi:hypothetical protein
MNPLLIKATDRFSETAIDEEIVVMSLASGDFFSLTGTARAIWHLIDGSRDVDQLVCALGDQYDRRPDAMDAEVRACVAELAEAGLIASN